ncbi:MAG TPA: glutamate racemase [Dissulfurispiraceae bacterium]|nr:glutamate racemase [Dissulfurispiraceae bacterium]
MGRDVRDQPVGIFDSGIGGLTVFKEVSSILPYEGIVYFGDTARVPYGTRSADTVTQYSFECTDFLLSQNIKLLVVACNTVSAICLQDIRQRVPIPVIGVIEPGAKTAAARTKVKRVGVIGTEATIRSGAYIRAIQAIDADIEVVAKPCPLFVPLVEEGWTDGPIATMVAERYLAHLKEIGIDAIVLGCTHYPLLKKVIQEVLGDVALIDSAVETARVVRDVLAEAGLENRSEDRPARRFFVTDSPEKFAAVGERFLEQRMGDVLSIKLKGKEGS